MTRLIPLRDVPYSARRFEAIERRKHATPREALKAAEIEIVLAPGCHGQPFPPTVGWVLAQEAGEALAARLTHMPGGTSHRRLRWRKWDYSPF